MPAFDDLLDEAQASAIQQYVLSRAAGATSARQ
jgi:mono/diheme cytochrome c family protein